jgi:tRNA A37 threonylcarbamoyladenosine synthetase subunit TsaC/SUA5/YrdC
LLQTLENPIISTSAHLPDHDELETTEKAELFDLFDKLVDLIIDDEQDPGYQTSSIIDFTNKDPQVVREGLGWETLAELMVGV